LCKYFTIYVFLFCLHRQRKIFWSADIVHNIQARAIRPRIERKKLEKQLQQAFAVQLEPVGFVLNDGIMVLLGAPLQYHHRAVPPQIGK